MTISPIGPAVPFAAASAATPSPSSIPAPAVRLDRGNFMLWRALTLPNFSGAGLHGYLDGTMTAPAKTITQGTGAAATTVANPAYAAWWTQD